MNRNNDYKIIIIDNDNDSIELLNNALNNGHCEIDNSYNEKEALDKIILNDYDYYFISDQVNYMNFINLIKEKENHPRIIVISSDTSFETEKRIRALGITYLLKKPFSKKEVRELIIN